MWIFQNAEDNRLSGLRLGENVHSHLVLLYDNSSFKVITTNYQVARSTVKRGFFLFQGTILEFFLLQISLHHPHGALETDPLSLAHDWNRWHKCLFKLYSLLAKEISDYLRQFNKKNHPLFNEGDGQILRIFELLFVETCQQVIPCVKEDTVW